MLRKLTIENFFSVKEPQTLDLTIGRKATDPDGRFVETIPGSGKRFPKVVVLFGANASGKTNVLRAIDFLARFIGSSATWAANEPLPLAPFASASTNSQPTRFSLEVDGGLPNRDGHAIYMYDLEIDVAGQRVRKERLRYNVSGRPRRLFERLHNDIVAGADFNLKKRDPVREKIHERASAISTLAQFNHPFAKALAEAANRIQRNVSPLGRYETSPEQATAYYGAFPPALTGFTELARKFDLGIKEVELANTFGQIHPKFTHEGLSSHLLLFAESRGTQLFYRLYPWLAFGLEAGTMVVLDELDTDIHPLVLPEIIRLFQEERTNPHNAQLIMSCHNVTLLEHLVKEEVFFTEKDHLGCTSIYGLKNVEGVRRDENIYANYLAGAYGAVPRLG